MFDKFKQLGNLAKLRQQITQLQQQLSEEEIVVEEQGVKVVVSGTQQIKVLEVKGISNQIVIDVINKAIKMSQEMAAKKLYGLSGNLPDFLGNNQGSNQG